MYIKESIQKVLPWHTEAELSLLKADILANGIINPIVTFRGAIIDGYARYIIAKEFGVPFETVEMDFANETEAILWRIKTHIGRRNLSLFQKCEMVLTFEPEIAAEARKRMLGGKRLPNNATRGNTVKVLADMVGVSQESIRCAKYVIENSDQETLRRVRKGELSIKGAYMSLRMRSNPPIQDVALVETEEIKADIERLGTIIEPIRTAVNNLITRVSEGDACPREIISELQRVSTLIDKI